jgi:hypothetical protein
MVFPKIADMQFGQSELSKVVAWFPNWEKVAVMSTLVFKRAAGPTSSELLHHRLRSPARPARPARSALRSPHHTVSHLRRADPVRTPDLSVRVCQSINHRPPTHWALCSGAAVQLAGGNRSSLRPKQPELCLKLIVAGTHSHRLSAETPHRVELSTQP